MALYKLLFLLCMRLAAIFIKNQLKVSKKPLTHVQSVGAQCNEWRKNCMHLGIEHTQAYTQTVCNPFLSLLPVVTAVTTQRN